MRLQQSSIPLIPGIRTSTYRLALPAGNSLASNSSALLKTNTLNLPQSLGFGLSTISYTGSARERS
jgi:hypothetical protein